MSGVTASPDAAQVAQQARNASMAVAESDLGATRLLRDTATKFVAGFDAVFAVEGGMKRDALRSPNLNLPDRNTLRTPRDSRARVPPTSAAEA